MIGTSQDNMGHPSDGKPRPLPKNWISDIDFDEPTPIPKMRRHTWEKVKVASGEKGFKCRCNALLLDRMIENTSLFENATWTALDLLYHFQEIEGRNWLVRYDKEKRAEMLDCCPPYES